MASVAQHIILTSGGFSFSFFFQKQEGRYRGEEREQRRQAQFKIPVRSTLAATMFFHNLIIDVLKFKCSLRVSPPLIRKGQPCAVHTRDRRTRAPLPTNQLGGVERAGQWGSTSTTGDTRTQKYQAVCSDIQCSPLRRADPNVTGLGPGPRTRCFIYLGGLTQGAPETGPHAQFSERAHCTGHAVAGPGSGVVSSLNSIPQLQQSRRGRSGTRDYKQICPQSVGSARCRKSHIP